MALRRPARLKMFTHPRSGTHWVLRTIFENFNTPYREYMHMFGGHKFGTEFKEQFPVARILHCSRDIQSVLTSVFRMRERNGIRMNSFSDFIRTPYRKMPRLVGKCRILFDNNMTTQPRRSWIQDQIVTPPELWLATNTFWTIYADLTITYEQMQADQEAVMRQIDLLTGWERKGQICLDKPVGWRPPNNKPFPISEEDQSFLQKFSAVLASHRKELKDGKV